MLFSNPSKIPQILEQIDEARCKGQWQAIPNLARRYVKHNPDGIGFEQIVLAEASLVLLGQTKKSWSAKEVQHIQDQLQSVFELSDGTSEEQNESAKVVLARLFFGCQEYDQTMALLDGMSLLNSKSSGYSFILYYQSLAIKAMSMEMMGDIQSSLQIYETISTLLDDRLPIYDLTLLEWAEQTLYRVNHLLRNQSFSFMVDQGTVLEFMRSYHRTTSAQPLSWRSERRLEIGLQMVKLLSKLYQSDEYIPYGLVDITELTDAHLRRKTFVDEITQLYTACAHLLQTTTSFPASGESNTQILDMIESLAKDLDLIMETTEDWRGYKEILEWALEKTFNSPPVLRLLFFTCLRLGEYEEAQHALQSYLHVTCLISYGRPESSKNGMALIQDIHGQYIPLPSSLPQQHISNATNKNNHCRQTSDKQQHADDEHVTSQLQVLLESVKMFCMELELGADAVDMANMALDLIQASELTNFDPQMEAQVYRSSGAAYSLLATQTIDNERRPKYHEKALSLLQHSNSIVSDSWETHYCLAHQYATMQNIDHAIQSIRRSLDLNLSHVASWHLLALALSCSGQKDRSQALQVAITGLDIGNRTVNSRASLYDRQEQQLLLQMTHSKLVNATEGAEKALEGHAALIKLYGKWVVEGATIDPIDFSAADGDPDGDLGWHGRMSYGDDDKTPRKLVVSGPFGNSPSIVLSSHDHDAASIYSPTSNTHTSLRYRSASSSMINHFTVSGMNDIDLMNNDNASVDTSGLYRSDNGTRNDDSSGCDSNGLPPSTVPQRTPTLRKYVSNSALRPSAHGQLSHHHWYGAHFFPSRSMNRQLTATQFDDNEVQFATTASTNGNVYNNPNSRQGYSLNGKSSSRYSSSHSIQSNNSNDPAGATTSSSPQESIHATQITSSLLTPFTSLLSPKKPRPAMTTRGYRRHQKQHSRLCELWLMSAQWYLELSETNEAMKAIAEAQWTCPDHPDLWRLMGQLHSQETDADALRADDEQMGGHEGDEEQQNSASPLQFFEKGLLLQPGHVGCQLGLAKLYIGQQDLCLAEGILVSLTQGFGWQSPEVWYLLGQLYQQTNRQQEAKDFLFYALDLELSRPIQPFSILPRLV